MEEWKTVSIGELCDTISNTYKGNAPEVVLVNTSDVLEGKCLNHSKVANKNLAGQFKKTFQKGDILYSEIRPQNKRFAFIDFEPTNYIASTKLMVLRCDDTKVLPEYFFNCITSPQFIANLQAIAESRSGTFPQITFTELAVQKLSLPPLPLQRRISSLLSSLDAKIETNRRINARLEEMAQALFRSWFIDFTPFKQQEFVEDEYGRRPKGWRFVELGEVTKECKDKVKERTDVKVLSPITTGQLVLSDEYFTKQVYSKELSKYIIVEPNAFAYNPARVNIGSIGINDHGFDGCVSPVYVVFKTLPNYERFMNLFIKTRTFKEEVLLRAIGGVRQTLNYTEFSLITTNWPPESVILKFNSVYDTIIKSIKQNEQESSRLASLRDTLLPKLMSGELIPEEITT